MHKQLRLAEASFSVRVSELGGAEIPCDEPESGWLHSNGVTVVLACAGSFALWDDETRQWRSLEPALEGGEAIHRVRFLPDAPHAVVLSGSHHYVSLDRGASFGMEEVDPEDSASQEKIHEEKIREATYRAAPNTFDNCFSFRPSSFLVGPGFSAQQLEVRVARSSCGGWRAQLVTEGETSIWIEDEKKVKVKLPSPFVVLTGGFSGTGTGAVRFNVLANPSAQMRGQSIRIITNLGTIAIPVSQQGNRSVSGTCSFTFTPTSVSIEQSFSRGEFSVRTPATCSWRTVLPKAPWLTLTGGFSGSGNGTIRFQALFNPGLARSYGLKVETNSGTFPVYVRQAGRR